MARYGPYHMMGIPKGMNPFAAGMSMFVSLLSAMTIIGLPVEGTGPLVTYCKCYLSKPNIIPMKGYMYGNCLFWKPAGGFLGLFVTCYIFLPKVYELRLYSIFRKLWIHLLYYVIFFQDIRSHFRRGNENDHPGRYSYKQSYIGMRYHNKAVEGGVLRSYFTVVDIVYD